VIRLVRACAAVTIALVAAVPLGTGTAQADSGDVTCLGTVVANYSPGLLLVSGPQTVTTNEIDSPCTSSSNPDVTSGQSHVTIQTEAGCLEVLQPGSASKTFTWNTGETSVFTYNRSISRPGGTSVVFAGRTALEVITFPNPNLLGCLTPPGVTSLFGVATLTIG
jgi:hypothetical protein